MTNTTIISAYFFIYSSFLSLLMLCAKSLQARAAGAPRVPVVTSVKDEETAKKLRESRRRKAQTAAVLQSVEGHRRRDRGVEDQNERNWIRSDIRAELVEKYLKEPGDIRLKHQSLPKSNVFLYGTKKFERQQVNGSLKKSESASGGSLTSSTLDSV
jgi:uncharacterized protein (UPF0254 family)